MTSPRRSTFLLLYRHFLKDYFFVETSSGRHENGLSVWHIVAFLFVPGIFLSGFTVMKTGPLLTKPPVDHVISGLDDRLVFIVISMVVAGLASVLNLHKLLPQERQVDTLSTLPISPASLLAAKVAAYVSFVLLFCADANLVSLFVYPLSAAPFDAPIRIALQYFAAHLVTMICCTALTIAIVSGCYAIVRILLPRAVTLFELVVVAASVAFLFVGPVSLKLLMNLSWARLNPALWFLGLYETLLPFPSPDIIFHNKQIVFGFAALAHRAVVATLLAMPIGFFAVLLACRRVDRERPAQRRRNSSAQGWLISKACQLVPTGIARAAATTYWATLSRVHECQLALALFMGTAVGVILNELSAADESSAWFFIAPFVLTFFLITGLVAITRLQVHLEGRWPLLITPAFRAREVRRGVNWSITIFALLPLLLVLAITYGPVIGYVDTAALMSCCGLLALLLLEAATWKFRIFPFAHEATTANQNLPFMFVGYVLALAAYGFILGPAAEWLLQHHKVAFANVFLLVAMIAVGYVSEYRNADPEVEFTEVDESEVQLLNIG